MHARYLHNAIFSHFVRFSIELVKILAGKQGCMQVDSRLERGRGACGRQVLGKTLPCLLLCWLLGELLNFPFDLVYEDGEDQDGHCHLCHHCHCL